jgi:hypothetical protein
MFKMVTVGSVGYIFGTVQFGSNSQIALFEETAAHVATIRRCMPSSVLGGS